jgi:hypothetical protein
MADLRIKPLQGIGDINFGMAAAEVRRLLGEPEKSVIDIRENSANLTSSRLTYSRKWAYPSLGIVLSFTAPNELAFHLRLRRITIEDADVTIDGIRVIGLTENEFLKAIARTQISDIHLVSNVQPIEFVDPECDIREYVCERVRMSFWIERGIVTSISMWDELRTKPYIKFKTTVKMAIPGAD